VNRLTLLRKTQLESRRARRVAVLVILLVTALLGSSLPPSFHGLGIVVVLCLVVLDLLLVRATSGLAFTRRRTLDERESALRDHAYRRGFRLLGVALAVEVLIVIATDYLSFALSTLSQNGSFAGSPQLNNVITGRGLAAIVELLVMLPTLMIAWADPDHIEPRGREPGRRAALLWLAVPALAAAWLLAVSTVPEQATAASTNSSSFGLEGATCAQFSAGRIVGSQFGATVGLRVGVCWNGTTAFVADDPSIPLPRSALAAMGVPAGTPSNFINPAELSVTACGADNLDDFATVSGMTCRGMTDAAGTLNYTVRAHVSTWPGGIGQRDVSMTVVIDRNGRVLARP
jgi:hypothetical protein